MNVRSQRAQRRAAWLFVAICIPAAAAVGLEGGGLALAPLITLILPILAFGRPAGIVTLDRLREKLSKPTPRRRLEMSRIRNSAAVAARTSRLLANSLAERAPPAPVTS